MYDYSYTGRLSSYTVIAFAVRIEPSPVSNRYGGKDQKMAKIETCIKLSLVGCESDGFVISGPRKIWSGR